MYGVNSLILLFLYIKSTKQSCQNDDGCQKCITFTTNSTPGSQRFSICQSCRQLHSYNINTNKCQCKLGYYNPGQGKVVCQPCDFTCQTCSTKNNCTSCSQDYNRVLNEGKCECRQGFQQRYSLPKCVKKTNVVLIICSTIGGCLILILVLILIYRCIDSQKPNSTGIHDISGSNNLELRQNQRMDWFIQDINQTKNQTPSNMWNSKLFIYKNDQICSICLQTQAYCMTDCGHYFHQNCISSWVVNKPQCPNCTKELHIRSIKVWCKKCKACLLPLIKNYTFRRGKSGKYKATKSWIVQNMICLLCQKQQNQKIRESIL